MKNISFKILVSGFVLFLSISSYGETFVFDSVNFIESNEKKGVYFPENSDHRIKQIQVEKFENGSAERRLNFQLQMLIPPTVLKPVNVFRHESKPNDDVVISAILFSNKSRYSPILARYTNKNGGLQVIEVDFKLDCTGKKGLKEYGSIEENLVRELFKLEI